MKTEKEWSHHLLAEFNTGDPRRYGVALRTVLRLVSMRQALRHGLDSDVLMRVASRQIGEMGALREPFTYDGIWRIVENAAVLTPRG